MKNLIKKVHVNIPFYMLYESYIERFLEYGLNPEIGFDAKDLDRFSLPDFRAIAGRLNKRGLAVTLHGPFMDLSPGSPDPRVRELTRFRFEQLLQLIPIFRPKTLVCHAGYDDKRYWHMMEEWVENCLELWSWLGQAIRREGSLLMLENVYEHDPDNIRIIFERLKGQGVGFCLDTGHQAAFSRIPFEEWLESLGPYLGQLHLHDNNGEKDEHLALGKGRIEFQSFFSRLLAVTKVPPVITLEPHKEEDLWLTLEYLEKIWPW